MNSIGKAKNNSSKRLTLSEIALFTVAFSMLTAAATLSLDTDIMANAAKPQKVIEYSNGYPSGAHDNLNIHGKDASYNCDSSPGGKSVFILENGDSTIQYVSNKKSSVYDLVANDPCASVFDGDPVEVQIPSEEQGYYVFARVPGNHQNTGGQSSLIMVPNPNIQTCNDTVEGNPDFGDLTSCPDDPLNEDLLALGLITSNGVYDLVDQEFVPVDNSGNDKGKGQGKSKAIDITGLFLWTGDVCDDSFDTNDDGSITVDDVLVDLNGDGVIDDKDLAIYLETNCTHFDSEWVFSVADLVVVDHEITNDDVKLLKLRFYPVSTTEFIR
ncbi:MAG TPA: hypothetical protein VLA01_02215 [Nitrosopumilaceae archaeon]|nr:hypothetical protein [Nitrosopumilaceae archaeon]